MANDQETAKEDLRTLLNFPELMLSDYSQDAHAEERGGRSAYPTYIGGAHNSAWFPKVPHQALNWNFRRHIIRHHRCACCKLTTDIF
jgi:hypothetical protein